MITIEQYRSSIGTFLPSRRRVRKNGFSSKSTNMFFPSKIMFSLQLLLLICIGNIANHHYSQTHKTLLIMSGLEQNPGPTNTTHITINLIGNTPKNLTHTHTLTLKSGPCVMCSKLD